MKTNKKTLFGRILSVAALILVLALVVVLSVQCGPKQPPVEQPGPEGPTKTEWPEAGVYYFDAGIDEYTLTLNVGDTFALIYRGESLSGSYTLEEGTLTLDFNAEGKENVTAALADNVITLTYEGASMRMLKKVNYTVKFETNGGNTIADATVLGGKTVSKPADPIREGFIFVGWYADSEFKTPYAFDASVVAGDITVYAQWSEETADGVEYKVNFDLNYEGAETLDAAQTIGGKLFDIVTPVREGYTFGGWWMSMSRNGEKLTYQYTDGMVLNANTTLYALWLADVSGTKLTSPIVHIGPASITWAAVNGARSYDVKVIGPDGVAVIDETTASTTVNVPFATYAAGEYEIRVTANANTGEADNSQAVRYFTNKALGTVSLFSVVGNNLVFNTVEHAEKYLITVVCGNADHQHTAFDNGTSRVFNFANCDMTKDGIKFIVTAVAEGYASSTSEEFIYQRELAAVGGMRFDEATQTVHWDEVADATYYMVSVKCGNSAHNHEFFNNGTQTFVSLKECAGVDGGIVVKVYPIAKGFTSPDASEYTYEKAVLATPSDVIILGTTVYWTAVDGADEYEVMVGDKTYKTSTNSFDLSSLLNWVEGTDYTVSVRAAGNNASLWSNTIQTSYYEMGELLTYRQGTLSWAPVIGATSYEICINDGPILTVTDANAAKITLTRAGVNVIKVRFADGANRSDWVTIEVFAHAVTFDTRGGSDIVVLYKAVGDAIELPTPTKNGYSFVTWYNVPGGPASNGLAYNDVFFAESGAIVLYAHYNANKYEINYNYSVGGSGDKTSDEVFFEQNYQLYVPVADSATGAFGGWFSAPYGTGIQYTDAKGNSLTPWNKTEGVEMYAFWVDSALKFTQTKVNGKDAYAVSAGESIALVDEITIPATYKGLPVAMISGNAFMDCTSLKVINIPETLEQISLINPFTGCINLEAVNVYDVEGENAGRYWSQDGVLFDNTTAGGKQAKIAYMPLAKTGIYRIPAGIVEIPEKAFAGSAITKVIIPASVTKIGKDAFAGCTKLGAVSFEAAVAGESEKDLVIAAGAFRSCTALDKIMLPARLTDINLTKYVISGGKISIDSADSAFAGCTSLVSVGVMPNNKNFKAVDGVLYSADGKTLLYCPSTKEGVFSVPAGTQIIAPGAFIGCDAITEVVIPNTVTYVGECAFYGLNSKLTKVTFAGNAFQDMKVGAYAFRSCSVLADVVFEKGSRVISLGEGAFYDCVALKAFTIPATMTRIDDAAFYNCKKLETVTFAENGKTLTFGEDVFYNCSSIKSITLPANVSEILGIFNGCTSLEQVNVSENSEYFTSVDGVLFNKNQTEILFFPRGKTGEYTLPATVTSIAGGVFSGNDGLSKLVLPNTLTNIGAEAFKNSRIAEIVFEGETLGESLTIGKSAFEGASIEELTLPAHTKTIGEYAFAGSSIENIALNEGLLTLGDYAFYQTEELNEIDLPATVTSIGAYCFAESALEWMNFAENSALEIIGDHAFHDAEDFGYDWSEAIMLPKSVKIIGNYAFANANLYCGILFEEGSALEIIGAYAFYFDGSSAPYYFEEITIPKNVTSIGAYAFKGQKNLAVVNFEEGGEADLILGAPYKHQYIDVNGMNAVELHRGHVFDACSYLEEVNFPARLVEIGEYSFYQAGSYAWDGLFVTFAEGSRLTTIGEGAFYYSNLVEITIPKSVRNLDPYVDEFGISHDRLGIGAKAFYGLYDTLTTVTFEEGGTEPLTIGEGAFYMCRLLTSVTLPARLAPYTSYTGDIISPFFGFVLSVGINSDTSIPLTEIKIEAGNPYYVDVDGVVFSADMTELIVCPAAKTGEITVPATVTKIHDRAFYQCTEITAIHFENANASMTVGKDAFRECENLTVLNMPSNTTSIGSGAFVDCESLTTLTLPAALPQFSGEMVEGCNSLAALHIGTDGKGVYYTSVDGIVFNAAMDELIFYPIARADESYIVPSPVKIIGAHAFEGNKLLKSVLLPSNLIEIRAYAFAGCSALTDIVIPAQVALIDDNAFRNCTKMSSIVFAPGTTALVLGDDVFNYNTSLKSIVIPARLAVMGDSVFYLSGLTQVEFEANSRLTMLGDSVFSFTNIESIALPAGLISIGDIVFYRCEALTSATFGEGLLKIGKQTFSGCTALESVSFPASLKTMGINTFYLYEYSVVACENLKTVVFAQGSQLESIPAGTFAYTMLEAFEIPSNVKEIADPDLTAANRNETPGAFQGCTALQMIGFADGGKCTKIGAYAFMDCTSLKFVTIPATVNVLGACAFESCESLESITVSANVTQLGERLFASCHALADVTLETKATELPGYMFANCELLTNMVIPSAVTSIGSNCFTGTGIEAFEVSADNTAFVAVDGVIYTADKTMIVYYPEQRKAVTLTIPKEVTLIAEDTFRYNTTLKMVVFEEGGSEPLVIGDSAFYHASNLVRVVLPARLTTIGEYAFSGCEKLIAITIPENVKTIAEDAFYGCENLIEVYNKSSIPMEAGNWDDDSYVSQYAANIYTPTEGASMLEYHEDGFVTYTEDGVVYLMGYVGFDTEITIPSYVDMIYGDLFESGAVFNGYDFTKVTISEGVEYMGGVFVECDYLTEVILPNSLKVLDGYCFYYCDALTTLTLPASLEELGSRVFYYCLGLAGEFVIPATVTYAGNNVFYGSSDLLLLVTPTERPSSWNSNWAGSNSVIYGFDGEEHTYTFETNGGEAIAPITSKYAITLPTPVKEGMYFDGWYDGADFATANKITGAYYSVEVGTLYAKWMTEEEYAALFAGKTPEDAIDATGGVTHKTLDESTSEQAVIWFKVTATEAVTLRIETISGEDCVIQIYKDPNAYRLVNKDSGYDEVLTYTFEAGETFYIKAYHYYANRTGELTVVITVE